jgi:hypothetical protein
MASSSHFGAAPLTPAQVQAKAALEKKLLEAVAQMHKAILDAKTVVYNTTSVERLFKVATVTGSLLGPLIGIATGALTAWFYKDRPSTEEAKQSIINALNSIDKGVVGRLHGEIWQVLNGQIAPEKWMNAYAEVIKGIAAQLEELGETTLAAHLRHAKDDIWVDLAWSARAFRDAMVDVLKTAVDIAKPAITPLFAAIGVVIGIYIISWLPKKR